MVTIIYIYIHYTYNRVNYEVWPDIVNNEKSKYDFKKMKVGGELNPLTPVHMPLTMLVTRIKSIWGAIYTHHRAMVIW